MKTRIIHTKIWTDEWFQHLTERGKIVFLYLITNTRIGLIDSYEISDPVICFETCIDKDRLRLIKRELNNKVIFCKGWVRIVNCEKYQTFRGEKNEIAKKKELNLIPSDVKGELYTLSIPYQYPIDTTSNKKLIISNKKPVIRNKKVKKVSDIIDGVRSKHDFLNDG